MSKPRSVRRLSAELARIPKNDENSLVYFSRRLGDIARRSRGKLVVARTNPGEATQCLVFCRQGEVRLEIGRALYAELAAEELRQFTCQKHEDDPVGQLVYDLVADAWRLSRCKESVAHFDVVLIVNNRQSSFAAEAKPYSRQQARV